MTYAGIDQSLFFKTCPAIAVNAALFLYALIARPRLRPYLLVFSATTLVDILVASKIIPIANPSVQTAIEYIFVLVGDLRFIILLAFLLYAQKKMADLERFRFDGSVVKPAIIFTMFASLIIQAIDFAQPGFFAEPRKKFLTYEIIFFTLTTMWIFIVLPQKQIAKPEARFLRRSAIPVFIFYGLWSLADILILQGVDLGHLVRIVPNLTYYCLFLPWVGFMAFQEGQRGRSPTD